MVEKQATPLKSPKTPADKIRRMRSKSAVDVPSTTPSRASTTPKSAEVPAPKCTAAKTKARPKKKTVAEKAKVKKALKVHPKAKAAAKAKGKPGKSQASGHSREADKASKKRKRDRDAATTDEKDDKKTKTKEEPKSPAATGKAIKECLSRAETRDMKPTAGKGKSKPAEPTHEESDCEDSDLELEEQLRRKRDQHARYMRFSRSLKSQHLNYLIDQHISKHFFGTCID